MSAQKVSVAIEAMKPEDWAAVRLWTLPGKYSEQRSACMNGRWRDVVLLERGSSKVGI